MILFVLSTTMAGLWHFCNWSALHRDHPYTLRKGVTVSTSDDPSYLAPAENWLLGNGWRSNADGNAAYVTRSPGYGLVYLVFRVLLSEKNTLLALVIFQILLWGLAVACIPKLCIHLGIKSNWASGISLVVAVLPTFSGFLSYTLTEGITPALVILFFSALFLPISKQRKSWVAGTVLGIILIIRPPLLILLSALLPLLAFRQMGWTLAKIAAIGLLPLAGWLLYTTTITGSYQGLHPIYQKDATDLYRPLHGAIWDFQKMWGQTAQEFHTEMTALWEAAADSTDPEMVLTRIIQHTDREALHGIGEENLKNAYRSYFETLQRQRSMIANDRGLEDIAPAETHLIAKFELYKKYYTRAHPFKAYIAVPLGVYWNLGGHSNLSLYVFQRSWRGNWLMEFLRYISYVLHLGIFMIFPIAMLVLIFQFQDSRILPALSMALPVVFFLGYLTFVQRGVEERYTLPLLVPMVLVGAKVILLCMEQFTFSKKLFPN